MHPACAMGMKKCKSFHCSVVSDYFVAPWTVACQVPMSMRFPRQEYWSRLPFPSPGDLPSPGIEARFPALQTDSLPSEPQGATGIDNKYFSF